MRLFIAFILVLLLIGCSDPRPPNLKMCHSDVDCIVVEGAGCCKCSTAINAKHLEYWNSNAKKENMKPCFGVVCQPCVESTDTAYCGDSVCHLTVTGGAQ